MQSIKSLLCTALRLVSTVALSLEKTKTCKLQPMNEFGCFLKRFFLRARQSFETREKKFVGQQKMDSPNTQVE